MGIIVNHNSHFYQSKPYYKHFSRHFCAQDIPRIRKKPPSSMTVKEGSNVSLPCYSKGFPNPEVTWYKNGQKLNSGKYNRDTGMLTFPSIQFSDRGLYRCEARNFIGVESATVKIVVEGTGNLICNVIVVILKFVAYLLRHRYLLLTILLFIIILIITSIIIILIITSIIITLCLLFYCGYAMLLRS